MRKAVRKDGAEVLVFERGDKMRRRFKRYLQDWRAKLPDPVKYSNGWMLRHPPEWYLEERHIMARPSIGLASLARFCEWLLYKAQKREAGGKAHALAARAFRLVQRRMRAYMYKQSLDSDLKDRVTSLYAGACRAVLAAAREAYEALRATPRQDKSGRARPLDTIHKDMI